MTGVTIAVAGAKGGVGKTTTAINLASALAMVTDQSIVTVDLDLAMGNCLDFVDLDIDDETDPTLHDVLAGSVSIMDAVYEAPGGIHIVPSGPSLEGYAAADPAKIRDALTTLEEEFDIVLIDTAAGVSYETILPLGLADAIVLVSTPRLAAVRDTQKTRQLAERVDANVVGVIFVRSGTGKAPGVEQLAEFLGVELLGHVPAEGIIPESQDAGQPVLVYEFASQTAKAYWQTAQRLNRIVRDIQFDNDSEAAVASDETSSAT